MAGVSTSLTGLHSSVLQAFIDAIVMGESRLIMEVAGEPQKGPYKAGKPASHRGKINYRQCKKVGGGKRWWW